MSIKNLPEIPIELAASFSPLSNGYITTKHFSDLSLFLQIAAVSWFYLKGNRKNLYNHNGKVSYSSNIHCEVVRNLCFKEIMVSTIQLLQKLPLKLKFKMTIKAIILSWSLLDPYYFSLFQSLKNKSHNLRK